MTPRPSAGVVAPLTPAGKHGPQSRLSPSGSPFQRPHSLRRSRSRARRRELSPEEIAARPRAVDVGAVTRPEEVPSAGERRRPVVAVDVVSKAAGRGSNSQLPRGAVAPRTTGSNERPRDNARPGFDGSDAAGGPIASAATGSSQLRRSRDGPAGSSPEPRSRTPRCRKWSCRAARSLRWRSRTPRRCS